MVRRVKRRSEWTRRPASGFRFQSGPLEDAPQEVRFHRIIAAEVQPLIMLLGDVDQAGRGGEFVSEKLVGGARSVELSIRRAEPFLVNDDGDLLPVLSIHGRH